MDTLFFDAIRKRQEKGCHICIGLDDIEGNHEQLFQRNKKFIDLSYNLVSSFKINSAFYESRGSEGIKTLKKTIEYIKNTDKTIPIILDAKRGDVPHTNEHYAKFAFEYMKADSITVSPFLGFEALEPFFKYKEKGVFILCKTSNKNSDDLQDLLINKDERLYEHIAKRSILINDKYNNIGLVVAGNNIKALEKIHEIAPEIPLLIPGIGSQGGDLVEISNMYKNSLSICTISRDLTQKGKEINIEKLKKYNQNIEENR